MKDSLDDILNIDMLHYVSQNGYSLVSNLNAKGVRAVNDTTGDKIWITTKPLPMRYFNLTGASLDKDRGNIINFVINRQDGGISSNTRPSKEQFSEAFTTLKKFINQYDFSQELKSTKITAPSVTSPKAIKQKIKNLEPLNNWVATFLKDKRYIDSKTFLNPLFKNTIMASPVPMQNGKVIYNTAFIKKPLDSNDIVGFTAVYFSKKNNKSEKRINALENIPWSSKINLETKHLFIGESPMDCLAHYELYKPTAAAYIAFEGGLSEQKKNFVYNAFNNLTAKDKQIISITDNDKAGFEYDLAFGLDFNNKKGNYFIENLQKESHTKFLIHSTDFKPEILDDLKTQMQTILKSEVGSSVYNSKISVSKTKDYTIIEIPRFAKNKNYFKFQKPLTAFLFEINNVKFLSHKVKNDDWNAVLKHKKILKKVAENKVNEPKKKRSRKI